MQKSGTEHKDSLEITHKSDSDISSKTLKYITSKSPKRRKTSIIVIHDCTQTTLSRINTHTQTHSFDMCDYIDHHPCTVKDDLSNNIIQPNNKADQLKNVPIYDINKRAERIKRRNIELYKQLTYCAIVGLIIIFLSCYVIYKCLLNL